MTEEPNKLMKLRIESPKSLGAITKVFLDNFEIKGITGIAFLLGLESRGHVEIKLLCDNILIDHYPETFQFIQKLRSTKHSASYEEEMIEFFVTESAKEVDTLLQKLDKLKKQIEMLERQRHEIIDKDKKERDARKKEVE